MGEFNSIDDFLGHDGGGGKRGRYLKSWTKNGSIKIWLHTRRLPLARWGHSIPQLTVFDDRRTGEEVKAFWRRTLTCWEDESFLKNQYARDHDGELEVGSPRKCSLCRLVDVVHQAIAKGEISWVEPIFRFQGSTDSKNDSVIYAGGLTGMFNSDKLSDAQKRELKQHDIYQSEAWAQNFHAKLQYIFVVVDNDNVKDGVQIAEQSKLVGDKVKEVISDARASLGEEDGNPMVNPYVIELTYDEKATIAKRYHARRIERIKLTSEVERLIREDPPSLDSFTRPFNQKALRAFLERHATVDLPWDRIFDVPVLSVGEDEREEGDRDLDFPPKEEPKPKPASGRRVAEKAPPPPKSSAKDVATIPCDKCGHPMREDETKCAKCGTEYEIDDADAEAEPPKKGEVKGDKLPFGSGGKKRF